MCSALVVSLATVLLGASCADSEPAPRRATTSNATAASPSGASTAGTRGGYTTIPSIPLYVSLERARRAVERRGLVPDMPEAVGPMYFIGTEPDAGTRVRVGSTVTILGGDG